VRGEFPLCPVGPRGIPHLRSHAQHPPNRFPVRHIVVLNAEVSVIRASEIRPARIDLGRAKPGSIAAFAHGDRTDFHRAPPRREPERLQNRMPLDTFSVRSGLVSGSMIDSSEAPVFAQQREHVEGGEAQL